MGAGELGPLGVVEARARAPQAEAEQCGQGIVLPGPAVAAGVGRQHLQEFPGTGLRQVAHGAGEPDQIGQLLDVPGHDAEAILAQFVDAGDARDAHHVETAVLERRVFVGIDLLAQQPGGDRALFGRRHAAQPLEAGLDHAQAALLGVDRPMRIQHAMDAPRRQAAGELVEVVSHQQREIAAQQAAEQLLGRHRFGRPEDDGERPLVKRGPTAPPQGPPDKKRADRGCENEKRHDVPLAQARGALAISHG